MRNVLLIGGIVTFLTAAFVISLQSAPGPTIFRACLEHGFKQQMQFVVPSNRLAAFRPDLGKYAAEKSLQFLEQTMPNDPEWGDDAGKHVIGLHTPYFTPRGSVTIEIDETAKKDTFSVGLKTCNWNEDWQPFWRDFQNFAESRGYRQVAN